MRWLVVFDTELLFSSIFGHVLLMGAIGSSLKPTHFASLVRIAQGIVIRGRRKRYSQSFPRSFFNLASKSF